VVQAVRAGAYDYLESALAPRRLGLLLRRLSDTSAARRRDHRAPASESAPLLESARRTTQ
jgi:DNA-binding NtrC family response regulator